MSIPAFPKIFTLGMKETGRIFHGNVEVTEKIDGSQFSFGLIGGELHCRSKGAIVHPDAPDNMFQKAAEFALSVAHKLPDNTVFHGEYLRAPKHNSLTYARVPAGNIMLFGIRVMPDTFISDHSELTAWAEHLGCEVVPQLFYGEVDRHDLTSWLDAWINTESELGKAHMEGVVIKNYGERALIGGQILPLLSAKYVSEKFKETHRTEWKRSNPKNRDKIGAAFCTEARWRKAIEHLRDQGELEQSPRDIGKLIAEIRRDMAEECLDEIKDILWGMFKDEVNRTATRGFPEWYKEYLVKENVSDDS